MIASMRATKVTRVLWSPIERPLALESTQIDLTTARVLVLGEAGPERAATVNVLRARGARVSLGYPGLGSQSTHDSWLVDGEPPTIVVDFGLAPPFTLDDRTTWRRPLLRSIGALRACYDSWSTESDARKVFYLAVTYLGGTMGYPNSASTGAPAISQPLGGLWAGLAKTLHRELPNCNARVIDVDDHGIAALPQIIADEVGRPGTAEIGYSGGRRWTLTGSRAEVGTDIGGIAAGSQVLISGGGRGIGYKLACRLAERAGVRVVVTGRTAVEETVRWAEVSETELAAVEQQGWETRGARSVRDVRAERDRNRNVWELATNLRSAQDRGHDIEYRQCDFTRRGQVRKLIAEFPDLTVIIHNAGVDSPSRLPGKTDDDILRTVSTKIDGLTNLLTAVEEQDIDLKSMCIVGSLTGRLGGMVGQFDYAAANDGLARLGMWAGARADYPVSTMAWPTWDNVGLIANFAASLRYMTPLDIDEGLSHWEAELDARTSGEVTFVGHLGRAIDPGQAIGYRFPADLPDHASTAGRLFHLGDVERYRPGQLLVSWIDTSNGSDATFGELQVDGDPAVTPTALIERILGAVDWIIDPGLPEPALQRIDDLIVDYRELRNGGRYCRTIHLDREGEHIIITAVISRTLGGPPAVSMKMLFAVGDNIAHASLQSSGPPVDVTALDPPATVHWLGHIISMGEKSSSGILRGRDLAPADRWSVPYPTSPALSMAVIEALLSSAAAVDNNRVRTAHIARVDVVGPRPAHWSAQRIGPHWDVTHAHTGAHALRVTFSSSAAHPNIAPSTRGRDQSPRSHPADSTVSQQ